MGLDASRLLEARSGVEAVAGDVLRVLYMFFGRLWLSEVVAEVNAFRRSVGDDPVEPGVVEEAVRLLERSGLVNLERGVRASLSRGSVPDTLVGLAPIPHVLGALSGDERIARYREALSRALEELRR